MDSTTRAQAVFEAAEILGSDDPKEIAKLVRSLEKGLPAEDELSVIVSWLGRCRLIHKLDQHPYPPRVEDRYRVPDLLATFDVSGELVTVLIEVKVSKRSLSWRPDYIEGLRSYSELLGLPLVVAWRHLGLWVMFDVNCMKKAVRNWNITFKEAMKENLLGVLAGDFFFSLKRGVALSLVVRKERGTADGFEGTIEEAFLKNPSGSRHNGGGGILQLFACVEQEIEVEETATHVVQSFVIDESDHGDFAHQILATVLGMFSPSDDRIRWRDYLLAKELPSLATPPWEAAKNGLEAGFVQHVISQQPHSWPTFVPAPERRVTPPLDNG